jgi:septal ring factor EnvC (AmiA/AmiB activator)
MGSVKRRPAGRVAKRLAMDNRLRQIRGEIARLKRERQGVRRDEFLAMTASLKQLQQNTDVLARHTADLATQFKRIAQVQVEVDVIKRALVKAHLLD